MGWVFGARRILTHENCLVSGGECGRRGCWNRTLKGSEGREGRASKKITVATACMRPGLWVIYGRKGP